MILTKDIRIKENLKKLIEQEMKLLKGIEYPFSIAPLVWERTNYHEFTLNNHRSHCETWETDNPVLSYNTHKSVGGDFFFYWTGMTHNYSGHPFQQGYNSDADSILGQKKYRCESIEEGKAICEAHWQLIGKLNILPLIVSGN